MGMNLMFCLGLLKYRNTRMSTRKKIELDKVGNLWEPLFITAPISIAMSSTKAL